MKYYIYPQLLQEGEKQLESVYVKGKKKSARKRGQMINQGNINNW